MPAKTKSVKRTRKTVVEWRAASGNRALIVLSPARERQIVDTVTGLLRVARLAMPDTYFARDSRVRRGQRLLAHFGRRPVE